jgi:virginiamycin B lyase
MSLEPARSPFLGVALTGAVTVAVMLSCKDGIRAERPPQVRQPAPSRAWLARLPDGPTKRQFIIDCTGCHQFDEVRAMTAGRLKTQTEWVEAIRRMLSFAGPNTSFPVISEAQNPDSTAAWLVQHLSARQPPDSIDGPAASDRVTEFLFPVPQDLPHDVAIDPSGKIVVTGMFSHKMFTLDPASGQWSEVPIPLDKANPRAVEIDGNGVWWVVMGGPGQIGRYDGRTWKLFEIGLYAHSVALGPNGSVYANGHFTRDPEQIVEVSAAGAVRRHDLPRHSALASRPGGPVPYELRAAPDGRIWMSELQGNRMVVLDPRTGATDTFTLPTPNSGPRRFDVDRNGILWIPTYGAGTLVRLDPATRRFEEIPLPASDAAPYVVRVDPTTGLIWIGNGAVDEIWSYDPKTGRFVGYQLPSRGALIRHLAIDGKRGDVWLAYGESPGKLPARIGRLRTR